MKVLKFGGTSVGSASRMKGVAALVTATEGPKVIVLSAVSGTTNSLVEISDLHKQGKKEEALEKSETLRLKYGPLIEELLVKPEFRDRAQKIIAKYFAELDRLLLQRFKEQIAKITVVFGELISTNLFSLYLEEQGVAMKLLSAVDFMYLNESNDPDIEIIRPRLSAQLEGQEGITTFVTQGFICRNAEGGTDNLKRGGSDYSATLIGAALKAEEVQIWTDIDGMHNNDPRVVDRTRPISRLSFDEAGELAYFGAKILHPTCIIPAQQHDVPVRIKNTMQPEAEGTLITSQKDPKGVKAIAAKSNITAIKIKSTRMIMAYGFLRKVFEVFETHKTSIDMITTSEIAVSLTIDDDTHLPQIVEEIKPFGVVEVDKDQTIICVVGDLIAESEGTGAKIFNTLSQVPIRMISFGGSKNNVSILVDTQYKEQSLKLLNASLFDF